MSAFAPQVTSICRPSRWITPRHLAISLATKLLNCSGVPQSETLPICSTRARKFGGDAHLLVQRLHDMAGCAGGVDLAEPGVHLEPRQLGHGLTRNGDVGDLRVTFGGGEGDGAHPPTANLLDAAGEIVPHELDIAGDQLGRGRPRAAEGNVNPLRAGELPAMPGEP